MTRSALAYANSVHRGQQRPDGSAFILHPLEVARLLHDADAPDHLIAAGLLHDVLEKTSATADELQSRFGVQVSSLVLAVSDDDRISGYAARKTALRQQVASAGDEALSLFAADKVSKLRELRREAIDRKQPGRAAPREPRSRCSKSDCRIRPSCASCARSSRLSCAMAVKWPARGAPSERQPSRRSRGREGVTGLALRHLHQRLTPW